MLDDITARPYFLRAFYDWCIDTKRTPYLLARWSPAQNPKVPSYLSVDGKIIFNISETAVRSLRMEKDGIFFTARFLGQTVEIVLPLPEVMAIYAQETGKGLSFPVAPAPTQAEKPAEKMTKTGITPVLTRHKKTPPSKTTKAAGTAKAVKITKAAKTVKAVKADSKKSVKKSVKKTGAGKAPPPDLKII